MRMSSPSLPQCVTHFSDGTGLVSRSGPLAEQRCVVCALLKACNQLMDKSNENAERVRCACRGSACGSTRDRRRSPGYKGHDPWLIQARGGCGCCTDSQPSRSLAWRWSGRHVAVSRPLCACLPHFLLSFARPLRYKGLSDSTTLGLSRVSLMVRWRVGDHMCRAPGPGDGPAAALWGWVLPHAHAPVASRCGVAHSPPRGTEEGAGAPAA